MEHEEWCTFSTDTSSVQSDGPLERVCSNRKCAIWLDLKTWFGYKSKSLSNDMYNEYFLDVAHGGNGSYEKLVLYANKVILDYIQEDLIGSIDPIELQVLAGQIFPNFPFRLAYDLLVYFWVQKHSEIVMTDSCLSIFANSYLHGGQKLISNRSRASYVKVLFSFSHKLIAGEHHHDHLLSWMPCFIKHITSAFKYVHLSNELENQFLLDLEYYLGYKYDHITPRIHECLSFPIEELASLSDINNGKEMLKLSCKLYFDALQVIKSEKNIDEIDLNEQVELLLNSGPLEVMCTVYMNLHKIASHNLTIVKGNIPLEQAKVIFERLVGACCCTIKKDSDSIFDIDPGETKHKFATMAKLVQKLHHIQIAIEHFQKMRQQGTTLVQGTSSIKIDKSVGTEPEVTSIFVGMQTDNPLRSGDKTTHLLNTFKILVKSYENLCPVQDDICCKMMELSSRITNG